MFHLQLEQLFRTHTYLFQVTAPTVIQSLNTAVEIHTKFVLIDVKLYWEYKQEGSQRMT